MSEPNEKLLNENEEKVNENEEKVEEIFTKGESEETSTFEPNGDASILQSEIETKRAELKTLYKKSKTLSNISVLVAVVLIIGCFILVSQNNSVLKIIGYCIGGAALVGMLIFYVLTKKKFPNATAEYINHVSAYYNSYAFHNDKYVDIFTDKNEKIEKGEIASDMVYSDISRVNSRNVVHAKFDKQHLVVADLVAYHLGPKNQNLPLFVGKYLSIENNVSFDGRIIIQLKNIEKENDAPTCLEDLEKVKEDENLIIYATKGVDYKAVLGTKLISEIRSHKVEGHLLNINIVVWGGHTGIYLSFDDETMVFPFENEFKAEPYVQYEQLQTSLLTSLCVLNKHKEIKTIKAIDTTEEVNTQEEVKEEQ